MPRHAPLQIFGKSPSKSRQSQCQRQRHGRTNGQKGKEQKRNFIAPSRRPPSLLSGHDGRRLVWTHAARTRLLGYLQLPLYKYWIRQGFSADYESEGRTFASFRARHSSFFSRKPTNADGLG